MPHKQSGASVLRNLAWRFGERVGGQAVGLVVTVVLARILDPAEYGRVALITVITAILQVFAEGGFGSALIQKKDADDLDFTSVFAFNTCLCLAMYAALYLCSPAIASFYNDAAMTPLIRVCGISILVSALKNVQQAYVSRSMQFKRFFFASLAGTLASALVGVGMALGGFGAWALVAQKLTDDVVDTAVIWFTVGWRPRGGFSWARVRSLFSYGWKLLASNLIDTAYGNMRQLIIGKVYSSSDLAYYNRGRQTPNLIVTNVNTSIDSVLFPAMSAEQDDADRLRAMVRRSVTVSNYVMAPLMMGLFAAAETLVRLVLTDKWLPCVPFMRVFCVLYMFQPIHTANTNAIKAMGRSDVRLWQEVVTKVVGILLLVLAVPHGVMAIALFYLAGNFFNQFVNSWPNKRLIGYSYLAQLWDIMPSTVLAVVMGAVVWCVGLTGLPTWLTLVLQVTVGVLFYAGGSALLRIEAFGYIKEMVKGLLKR